MNGSYIKYLSHKIKRKKKNKCIGDKNHFVVVLEPKIVKIRDVSKAENIPKVPEDEILGSLPSYLKERSSVLTEPIQPIIIRMEDDPQIIHID